MSVGSCLLAAPLILFGKAYLVWNSFFFRNAEGMLHSEQIFVQACFQLHGSMNPSITNFARHFAHARIQSGEWRAGDDKRTWSPAGKKSQGPDRSPEGGESMGA